MPREGSTREATLPSSAFFAAMEAIIQWGWETISTALAFFFFLISLILVDEEVYFAHCKHQLSQ